MDSNEGFLFAVFGSFDAPYELNIRVTLAKVQSSEMALQPTPMRAKSRSLETINTSNKNFTLAEIYNVNESSLVDEIAACTTEDQTAPDCVSISKLLEGWQIETRMRKNGKLDNFYHHELSNKMFRSPAEVKVFIKKANQQGSLPYAESSQQASLRRKRSKRSPSTNIQQMTPAMAEEFLASARNKRVNFFTTTKENESRTNENLEEENPEMTNLMIEELLNADVTLKDFEEFCTSQESIEENKND